MTINQRLFDMMEQRKIKMATLAQLLNINKTVVSAWKSRGTNPPIEYTVQICELLGITLSYYIMGKEELDELTTEEKRLLEAYRVAAPAMQEAARKILDIDELPGKSLISEPGKEAI